MNTSRRVLLYRRASSHHQPAAASTTPPIVPLQRLPCAGPPSPTDHFPLALPKDEACLTPLHCFVHRHCVEAFVATMEDVAIPCMGKRDPVTVGQVGLRCPYRAPERTLMGATTTDKSVDDVAPARENAVVLPRTIGRI